MRERKWGRAPVSGIGGRSEDAPFMIEAAESPAQSSFTRAVTAFFSRTPSIWVSLTGSSRDTPRVTRARSCQHHTSWLSSHEELGSRACWLSGWPRSSIPRRRAARSRQGLSTRCSRRARARSSRSACRLPSIASLNPIRSCSFRTAGERPSSWLTSLRWTFARATHCWAR